MCLSGAPKSVVRMNRNEVGGGSLSAQGNCILQSRSLSQECLRHPRPGALAAFPAATATTRPWDSGYALTSHPGDPGSGSASV